MAKVDYKIRQATRKELDIAVKWATKEGWNPGLHDAQVFWDTDPKGFFVLEKDGKIIGSESIVSYNGKFGFIGFYIIKPEYRGKKYGTRLSTYCRKLLLQRLEPGAAIGFDGMLSKEIYARNGYVFSHTDFRMESTGKKVKYDQKAVQKIASQDLKSLSQLDKKIFGFDRKRFLKGWLFMKDSHALKYVTGSKIKGYGVIRKCHKGFKIGPLFAPNYHVAHELFKALSSFAIGKKIYLDIPEINKDALKLAHTYKMKECFGCARMYLGPAPKLPYNQIFGVTTFELG